MPGKGYITEENLQYVSKEEIDALARRGLPTDYEMWAVARKLQESDPAGKEVLRIAHEIESAPSSK